MRNMIKIVSKKLYEQMVAQKKAQINRIEELETILEYIASDNPKEIVVNAEVDKIVSFEFETNGKTMYYNSFNAKYVDYANKCIKRYNLVKCKNIDLMKERRALKKELKTIYTNFPNIEEIMSLSKEYNVSKKEATEKLTKAVKMEQPKLKPKKKR